MGVHYCVEGERALFVPLAASAEAPLGYAAQRLDAGCLLDVPNAAITVRESSKSSALGQTYEVCPGAAFTVNGGSTTVYARAGSSVSVNAAGATVYAEPGVELSINGGNVVFLGDLEDYGTPNPRPELVSNCQVTLEDGGC